MLLSQTWCFCIFFCQFKKYRKPLLEKSTNVILTSTANIDQQDTDYANDDNTFDDDDTISINEGRDGDDDDDDDGFHFLCGQENAIITMINCHIKIRKLFNNGNFKPFPSLALQLTNLAPFKVYIYIAHS